ncbi:MAG TPA: hypothetical protein DCS93_16720 [Microscillaceae bacterium]|nr:hypothetical protein [Microscillaceae bacterium]
MCKIGKIEFICVAIILFFTTCQPNQAQPKPSLYSGNVTVQGIKQQVEIFFDNYGIPHIYAQNIEDAYFALGYVQARERISQFEFFRRLGTGTLAEVIGINGAAFDVPTRTFGIVEQAKKSARLLKNSPNNALKKSITAYLKGVNTHLADLNKSGEKPKDFLGSPTQYTLEDMYATLGGFLFGFPAFGMYSDILTDQLVNTVKDERYLSELKISTGTPVNTSYAKAAFTNNIKNDLKKPFKFHKHLDQERLNAIIKFQENYKYGLKNSNSWVLSGKMTTTGKPLFSSDAHVPLAKPDTYYEAHLVYPGHSIYGLFFPLAPLCGIGYNQNISWGITTLLNDDIDLYREKQNPENPNQVWENDRWKNVKVRKEVVKILQKNGTLKDSVFEVKITRHGPIINQVKNEITEEAPISMFYTGFKHKDAALESFFEMSHAQNLLAFTSAVSKQIAPGFNVHYADKQGNIAWFAAAKLLKRPSHVISKVILDGASGKDEPLGYYPFRRNPKSINPPEGFVMSANHQIGKVDGTLYPGYYVAGVRAKRLKKIFGSGKKFSSQDLQKLFFDDVSPVFKAISEEILKVLEDHSVLTQSEHHRNAARILKSWKGDHSLNTRGPVVFYQLYVHLLKNYFEDEVGKELFELFLKGDTPVYGVIDRSFEDIFFNKNSVWIDNKNTPKKETRKDIFAKSFGVAIDSLVSKGLLGKQWKEVHLQYYINLPALFTGQKGFDLGPYPLKGGINTINKVEIDLLKVYYHGDYRVAKTSGPNNRTLVDFSDMDNKSLGVLPTGQSGLPKSKFYSDQAKLYNNDRLRKMLRNRTEIEKKSTKLILKK